ncbi:OmpH family outer membrane protein [Luteolibacter flavescens]|uniref:OmpH family outer membrane protein n=1 Tax=Luteolibacter flavescens TaxID=1859460 RepID=A0ABT3FUX1_9BACT|nr:OmpH family outer membrane protein [Luteolibacter flavescens]MCW1887390.1 OmpH family outer membrane protein [Luteolibacter flavescens]
MKLSLRSVIALSLAFGGISAAQDSGRLKIATVDMQALFMEYNPTKETKVKFEEEGQGVAKQFEQRTANITAAKADLDAFQKQLNDPSVADTKKQEIFNQRQVKMQEAEALQREAEDFRNRKVRAMQEQMQIRTKNILDQIRAKVQKYAEAEGFDYVLDKTGTSTSQVPVLLYTKDATDVTDALLKTLNDGTTAPATEEKK